MNGRPLRTCPKCLAEICARRRDGSGGLYPHKCRDAADSLRKAQEYLIKTHPRAASPFDKENRAARLAINLLEACEMLVRLTRLPG